jgi:hypothetical protein
LPGIAIIVRSRADRRTQPDSQGVEVVLPAIIYAKIVEQHAAVADLELIDRTIQGPHHRRPDVRPGPRAFHSS